MSSKKSELSNDTENYYEIKDQHNHFLIVEISP